MREDCASLGVRQLSWAPTSLAALAVARSGLSNGFAKPLAQLLDGLSLETLTQVAAHQATLARLGCRTLGQIRALPRGGLSRRFDAQLLATLDQAYGLRPETYPWAQLPETFHAKLELIARVEHAPAMLFGARRLMLQMAGWLMARRSGVTAFTLRWCHDAMRAKTAGDGGELTVRTAQATRDTEHLIRLLAEHLGKVELLAPVGDLELLATEVQALEEKSFSMLPEARQSGESLALVLERIAARLGPDRVLRPVILEDHRLKWMCRCRPAPAIRHAGRPICARSSDKSGCRHSLALGLRLIAREFDLPRFYLSCVRAKNLCPAVLGFFLPQAVVFCQAFKLQFPCSPSPCLNELPILLPMRSRPLLPPPRLQMRKTSLQSHSPHHQQRRLCRRVPAPRFRRASPSRHGSSSCAWQSPSGWETSAPLPGRCSGCLSA